MFFKFRDNSHRTNGYPWAQSVSWASAALPQQTCAVCGRNLWLFRCEGPIYAQLVKGTRWPDAIGSGSTGPSLFLSERVIDQLLEAGVDSFEAHPVVLEEVKSKKLRSIAAPQYYYINVLGHMDFDLEASGLPSKGTCALCHRYFPPDDNLPHPWPPRRTVPLENTWDGSDVFTGRNFGGYSQCCTGKVLLLAREHRWTNFRFEPLDILHRDSVRWAGIDYLGKQWPPEYYPAPTTEGKSAEYWLGEYFSSDPERSYKAIYPLLELGPLVVHPLHARLTAVSGREGAHIGRMLITLYNDGTEVSEQVRQLAEQAVEAQDRIDNPHWFK